MCIYIYIYTYIHIHISSWTDEVENPRPQLEPPDSQFRKYRLLTSKDVLVSIISLNSVTNTTPPTPARAPRQPAQG